MIFRSMQTLIIEVWCEVLTLKYIHGCSKTNIKISQFTKKMYIDPAHIIKEKNLVSNLHRGQLKIDENKINLYKNYL